MGHRKNRALVCDGERRLREWGAPVLGLPASAAVQVAVGGVRPQTLSSLQGAARATVRHPRARLHQHEITRNKNASQTRQAQRTRAEPAQAVSALSGQYAALVRSRTGSSDLRAEPTARASAGGGCAVAGRSSAQIVATTRWSPDEKSSEGDSILAMSSASNRRRSSLKRTATFAGALNVIQRSTVIVDRSCCARTKLRVRAARRSGFG
jgi:hypothetical protein